LNPAGVTKRLATSLFFYSRKSKASTHACQAIKPPVRLVSAAKKKFHLRVKRHFIVHKAALYEQKAALYENKAALYENNSMPGEIISMPGCRKSRLFSRARS